MQSPYLLTPNFNYMDPFLSLVAIIVAALVFLLRHHIASEYLEPFNSSKYTAYKSLQPMLFSINGCGLKLYTAARQDISTPAASMSAYLFVSLFYIPILPLKCYRVVDCDENKYIVYGPEQWRFWEVVYIYVTYYRWVAVLIAVALVILAFIYKPERL